MVIKLRAYFAGISILTWILGIKTMCIPVLIIGWVLLILTILLVCIILVVNVNTSFQDFIKGEIE